VIVVLFTFGNNYLEIFNRVNSKPEFNKSLAFISSTKDVEIKLLSKTKNDHIWLLNYLKKINFSKYENLNFLNYNELNDNKYLWILCYLPLGNYKCNLDEVSQNYIKTMDKSFYLINVSLYEKK